MTNPAFKFGGGKTRFIALLAVVAAFTAAIFADEAATKRFDLPGGDAAKSLRLFSSQSGLEVVFAPETAAGASTNAVQGDYTPQDAARLLLQGTGLVAVQDAKTGAFMVNRSQNPPAESAASTEVHSPNVGGLGTIIGRVFSPDTGEYLHFAEIRVVGSSLMAYSGPDGSYSLTNVPSGRVTLSVNYTGFNLETLALDLAPGETATRQHPGLKSPGQESKGGEGPVVLRRRILFRTAFPATPRRSWTSGRRWPRSMTSPPTPTVKSLAATSGNSSNTSPARFWITRKAMPRAAPDRGLDPKYTSVTIDGMQMASAQSGSFGTNSRQFEFEEASINSVDTIELSKTLDASMVASAPAGVINLVSKNAFDLTQRILSAELDLTADGYGMTLHGTPTFNDKNQVKVFPGGSFEYGDSFGGRFGVYISFGNFNSWNPQGLETNTYATGATGTQLSKIMFKDGPTENHRYSAAVNLDYKINDHLSFSIRNTGSRLKNEFINQNMFFDVSDLDPSSNLTHVVAQTNGQSTNLEETLSHRLKIMTRPLGSGENSPIR